MLEKFIEFRARGQLELGNQLVIFKGISGTKGEYSSPLSYSELNLNFILVLHFSLSGLLEMKVQIPKSIEYCLKGISFAAAVLRLLGFGNLGCSTDAVVSNT